MRMYLALAVAVLTVGSPVLTAAQAPSDRHRARIHNRIGWEHMRAEQWSEAAKSFEQAIDLVPDFEHAYYGLGRANLAMKRYLAAIGALERCRDLYQAQAGRQFTNAQEAQHYRNDRIIEIDEQIRLVQTGPQDRRTQDTLRQLQNARRNMQENIQRGQNIRIEMTVPPWVSLSLGSAYFRAGRLADAEREYKATIAADSKSGEAHNNLAVVFLETGRVAEAEAAIRMAKKAGFRVHPQLESDIMDRRRGGR